ncbi:MAG: hypothetical protein R2708_24695 [Vicinamibacterales bacterium]
MFDLRLPAGLLFTLIGLLLSGFGLVAPADIYRRSFGLNVNLAWGLVVLAVGVVMLGLAWRSARGGARHGRRR